MQYNLNMIALQRFKNMSKKRFFAVFNFAPQSPHRTISDYRRILPSKNFAFSRQLLIFDARKIRFPLFSRYLLTAQPDELSERTLVAESTLSLQKYFAQVQEKLNQNEINQQRPSSLQFIEYENWFAYQVIKNSKEYERTIGDVIRKTAAFDENKYLSSITNFREFLFKDETEEPALTSFIESIKSYSTSNIISLQKYLLTVIPFYEAEQEQNRIYFDTNFKKVWQTLDSTASAILEKMSLSKHSLYELMAIAGLWFELGLAKEATFIRVLVRKLLTHNRDFDKISLLNLMFMLNINRSVESWQVNSFVATAAAYLDRHEDLTFDELSVMALGFFKTQTKMPQSLVSKFIHMCTEELRKESCALPSTISVASNLKAIRFSLETPLFDARSLRYEVKHLVDELREHKANVLESNICLTHIILLLNSSYLQNWKQLYKAIFDRMLSNLHGFRIKDIERILYCLANVRFQCNRTKLRKLEDYLIESEESKIYPYHVYSIVYFLLTLDFYPHKLLTLCADQNFLQNSINSTKLSLYNTLLICDTLLRLETSNYRFLTQDQIKEFNSVQMEDLLFETVDTKKGRFTNAVHRITREHFREHARLMYLFPFAIYPFPVILNERTAQKLKSTSSDRVAHPYDPELIKPDYFRNCIALFVVVNRDKTSGGSNLRGFSHINYRLLKRLGFQVLMIDQKDYLEWVMPINMSRRNSEDDRRAARKLINTIEASHKTVVRKHTDNVYHNQ